MRIACHFTSLTSILVVAAALAGTDEAVGQDKAMIAAVRSSTIKLIVKFSDPSNPASVCDVPNYGSGAILTKNGFVLTVAHIFTPPEDCAGYTEPQVFGRIGFVASPTEYKLRNVGKPFFNWDVALLKIGATGMAFQALPVCDFKAAETGDPLYGFGFPLEDDDFQVQDTTWQSADGKDANWVVSGDFTFGFSGGPVTTVDGRLVGLVKGGRKGANPVKWVVPVSFANEALFAASIRELPDCGSASSQGTTGPLVGTPGAPLPSVIVAAQTALRTAGYYSGNVDGVIGPQTLKAVTDFQSSAGLVQTGQLDTETIAALGSLPTNAITETEGNPSGNGQIDGGWVYLGIYRDGRWQERNFDWVDASSGPPSNGQAIMARTDVNVRSDFMRYDAARKQWVRAGGVGAIGTGSEVTVTDSVDVTDGGGFIWAQISR